MASKHREEHIIAAVSCPQCGAGIGESCNRALRCHAERRQAWLQWKQRQPPRSAIHTTGALAVAQLRELATGYACSALDPQVIGSTQDLEAMLASLCTAIEVLTVGGNRAAEMVEAKERARVRLLARKERG